MIRGIRGIHHTAMSVPNLDEAIEFYVNKVGMELVAPFDFDDNPELDQVLDLKHAAARSCMLRAGNLHLEIWEYSNPAAEPQDPKRPVCDHGYTHMCFDVDLEEQESVYKQLEEAGMEWNCDLTGGPEWGVRIAYGRDPFGNVWELQAHYPDHVSAIKNLPRWKD